MDYCGAHFVNVSNNDYDNFEDYAKNAMKLLTKSKLKYGDLILSKPDIGYRNQGVNIFDGVNIVALETEPDDYGCLPKKFTVLQPNFLPNGKKIKSVRKDYWHAGKHYIDHNTYVMFDYTRYDTQFIDNIIYDNKLTGENEFYTSVVTEDGLTVYLLFKNMFRCMTIDEWLIIRKELEKNDFNFSNDLNLYNKLNKKTMTYTNNIVIDIVIADYIDIIVNTLINYNTIFFTFNNDYDSVGENPNYLYVPMDQVLWKYTRHVYD